MRLQDHIDFTTLQWVKPELDDTLSAAREALEAYVENPDDRDAMRSCVDKLHQVRGTLQMVELHGAAMVADEMETLGISLLEDHVLRREDAYAALMRGLMQLPDYMERLSSGHRDVPVVLLPLLNELRTSRQVENLTEAALFQPRLDAPLPAQTPGAASEADAIAQRGQLVDLRVRFQHQLLAWFRGQQAAQQLVAMRDTLNAIAARCYSVPGRRLWWIAAATLEGLERGMLKNHATEVRQLIGKVDRSIRQLVEQGEHSLRGGDADELSRQLLYIVAQATQRSPQMELLRSTYALDGLLPNAADLEHARGSMAGHNRALLDSVARAIKEDLLRVKESLDLFLRQEQGDPVQLAAQGEVLERVGDTLGMLALTVPRRVVAEQRRVIDEIATQLRPADDETLLDVAGALLYVESSLDDHIENLGAEELASDAAAAPMLPRSEARNILATLMQEAIANTGRVKDAVVAFVESGWDHATLKGAPMLMDEVAGAMRMLSTPRPGLLAEGVGRYIGNELLVDRRVPSSAHMDNLADAMAALEYYLEAAREHRGGLEHILDVAQQSLGMLAYWPVPAARHDLSPAPVLPAEDEAASVAPFTEAELASLPELSESVSLADGEDASALSLGTHTELAEHEQDLSGLRFADTQPPSADTGAEEGDWIQIEEQIVEHETPIDELAAKAGFQLSTEGIDDDIREIFLEEMQEEIDNIGQARALWLRNPEETSALTSIRRSFHTLKGSGRLVGAATLGEFAWRVEDMLNRVLDRSIEPHDGVTALLGHAADALPQLLGALRGEATPTAPLSAIIKTAERLAAGEHTDLSEQLPATREVVRTVTRRVPAASALADQVPQATLTDAVEESTATQDAVNDPYSAPTEETIELPVMPPVDPVLLEILRSEVAQYLQTIRAAIGRSAGELRIDDGLLRAVHTLHGAIAMVDIALLTHLLSPLESLLKRLRASSQPLSVEGVQLLGRSADVVDHVMAQFDAVDPQLPMIDDLMARLVELRDEQPEASVAHVVFDRHADDLHADDIATVDAPDDADSSHTLDAELEADLANALAQSEASRHAAESLDASIADALAGSEGDVADFDHASIRPFETEPADSASGEPVDEWAERDLTDELSRALETFGSDAREGEAVTPAATPVDDSESFKSIFGDLLDEPQSEPAAAEEATPEAASLVEDEASEGTLLEKSEPAQWPLDESERVADEPEAEPMADHGESATAEPPALSAVPDLDAVHTPYAFDKPRVAATDADASADAEAAPDVPESSDPSIVGSTLDEVTDNSAAAENIAEPLVDPADRHEASAAEPGAGEPPAEETVTDETLAEETTAFVEQAPDAEPVVSDDATVPQADVPIESTEPVSDEPHEALAEPIEATEPQSEHADEEATAQATAHDEAQAELVDASELWHGQIDADLLEVFTEEAREILDHADGELAAWRSEPAEMAHVAQLQRDLHTLKGGARIAGMMPVGDLAHAIETLLEQPVGSDPVQQAGLIRALEGGFDQMHVLVQRVSRGEGVAYPQAMIDQLLALAGEDHLGEDRGDQESPAIDLTSLAPAPVVQPMGKLPELLPELLPETHEEGRSPQEQIRVRAELLDDLVNHAGEVAIYRSRLEQQVAGYRFNLVELDQTVVRLRTQLRMLEIETEAQIIARFQRENREAGMAVFDPLELDRFSQLQQYSRALAESVSDLVSIQSMLDDLTRQSETLLIQQSRVSTDLQEGLLRTRMLPFDTMVPNLRRTLRQAAQDQGKRAQLYVEGAHGEMDRNLLDRIKAPFEHMLRNAVAHGIESLEDRLAAGKPEEGAVRIRVAREATEVVVRVTDDGRGLDREAIRSRAIERGLLRSDARASDDQLLSLIVQPGFSTASAVTQLSGRGVGMDVVANEIKQLGGSLSIESQPGQGTAFVLRLPFTLAVTQAILVRIGESTFAIPMTSVQGVARLAPSELVALMDSDAPTFQHEGEDYGIHDLAELLGIAPGIAPDEEQLPLLLTRAGDLRAAIRIDAVIGSREIVVKSVGPQISSVPGLLGATIMGDGSVLVILDLAPLVRYGMSRREARLAEGKSAVQAPFIEEVRTRPVVMVVDDSITMRKVTGRVLERHEYEVTTAKDGIDALEKLHERVPDLMLLDIEMPRMDGYELATQMKADPRLREVPIIMITSRSGEKHRQRAFDIGVDRYLGKPYQEAELLAQIGEVLEQRAMELDRG